MVDILFLDDMEWRHKEFERAADRRSDVKVLHVWTADDAIELLGKINFVQAFLDHDLSENDIMIKVGERGTVPTGMTVVDHIMTIDDPPLEICIHSCNAPAAEEMAARLSSHKKKPLIKRVPFPELMHKLR